MPYIGDNKCLIIAVRFYVINSNNSWGASINFIFHPDHAVRVFGPEQIPDLYQNQAGGLGQVKKRDFAFYQTIHKEVLPVTILCVNLNVLLSGK